MDLGLKNKVVVVTGAASGIGTAVARAFCDEGARTVFTDIDTQRLRIALTGYEKMGVGIVCDVSDAGNVAALFEEVETRFETLHVLVNNAAVNTADYIENIDAQDLERVLDINVKGYIHTTREAIPLMKKGGFGRLVFINSGSGLKASAGLSLYSASKYFNRGFAIASALELGRFNITANSICPSDIYPQPQETDSGDLAPKSWQNESLLRISLEKEGVDSLDALIKKRNAKNPMGHSCSVTDVANLALFLASECAGFINGQSIGLNGGALPY
jgi:NAD(P)-dependent dehydrogenase (short-subunit alcohol dehydrogenase family)